MKATRSTTFREILESSRQQAATSAWERGVVHHVFVMSPRLVAIDEQRTVFRS